ncbi:MAG: hypothetical protein LBJ70_04745 [Holosporales bacterium]|jgi:glucose-6-phosphate isomerase|nr:hypothetical protein [Holosporales bacterium]
MIFQHVSPASSSWTENVARALKTRLERPPPCLSLLPTTAEVRNLARRFREQFSTILVLGTGGSSLGGQVLHALAPKQAGPSLIFLEDIHPEAFYATLSACDPAHTGVVAISKSGRTTETLCQLLAIFEHFCPPQQTPHFCVLTEAGPSPLRALAETYSFDCIAVPSEIGGRFSVFSVTGLFPALLAGVEEEALLRGARAMQARLREGELLQALAVAAEYAHAQKPHIFLEYDPRLNAFARWYQQLWSETLGKEGRGSLFLTARGTIDQHSQFQLYLDGPKGAFFTALGLAQRDTRRLFRPPLHDGALDLLSQTTMGHLLEVEFQASCDTLRAEKIPIRQGILPVFDAETMGALLSYSLHEVLVVADLLFVDPFSQPAIERLKERTLQILGRP